MNQQQHHDNRQQCVKVIRYGLHENADAILVLDKAGNRCRPAADGGNDANRGCSAVNQVRQLGATDIVLIRHRTHDATHRQAVEVVVNKNQAPQQHRGTLRPRPGVNMARRPSSKGGRPTRAVHELHHHAQNNQKNQNAHIPVIGQHLNQAVLEHVVQRLHRVVLAPKQRPGQDAQEE